MNGALRHLSAHTGKTGRQDNLLGMVRCMRWLMEWTIYTDIILWNYSFLLEWTDDINIDYKWMFTITTVNCQLKSNIVIHIVYFISLFINTSYCIEILHTAFSDNDVLFCLCEYDLVSSWNRSMSCNTYIAGIDFRRYNLMYMFIMVIDP